MMGADIDNPELMGIIPRIVEGIFSKIQESPPSVEYLVKAAYMEIYMERIRDLLNFQESNLPVHEDKTNGVYVKGLLDIYVNSIDEVYGVMRQGGKNRVVAHTNMNAESSRSHSIFQLTIEQKDTVTGKTKMGRLFLVDLAGSEKVGKTGATGQTLEEAKKINKSLSALGMVINALTDGKSTHIPYRDSKLTRILQESLGGNSRTTLIINCSPALFNAAETVSTLRFGMRAKSIKNKAKINQEFSPAELKQMLKKTRVQCVSFQAYISALEGEVKVWRSGGSVEADNYVTWEKTIAKEQKQPAAGSRTRGTPRSSTPAGSGRVSVSAGAGNNGRTSQPSPTPSASRVGSPIPQHLQFESLAAVGLDGSRSASPTTTLTEDEREELMRNNNELSDQVAERDRELEMKDIRLREMEEELKYLRVQSEDSQARNNELAVETSKLKAELEKMGFDQNEAQVTIEGLVEVREGMNEQLQKLRQEISELHRRAEVADNREDGKLADMERERELRVAAMLDGLDSTKAMSRHEEGMGDLLRSLVEAGDDDGKKLEMLSDMRRQLDEATDLVEERDRAIMELQQQMGQLKVQCSESDQKYDKLSIEYEAMLEQSIADEEEATHRDTASLNDLKQKLEDHYNNKISDQRMQLDTVQQDLLGKVQEVDRCKDSIRELRGENRELQAKVDSLEDEMKKKTLLMEGSSDVVAATEHAQLKERELHAMRREMVQKMMEYDTMRKSLMRDVQNRCEKIIELEIALEDSRNQVATLTRRVGNQAQPQRMQLLEKNIQQLTLMQREMVAQNSELKQKVNMLERRLQARTERIEHLEKRVKEANDEYEAMSHRYEESQNRLHRELNRKPQAGGNAGVLRFSRIAKPMRGGGGAVEEKSNGQQGGFYTWGANA